MKMIIIDYMSIWPKHDLMYQFTQYTFAQSTHKLLVYDFIFMRIHNFIGINHKTTNCNFRCLDYQSFIDSLYEYI